MAHYYKQCTFYWKKVAYAWIHEWFFSALHVQCNLNIFLSPPQLEILEPILYAICSIRKDFISDSRNYTVWERTSLQQKYRIDWTKFQANSIPFKKRLTNYCIFFIGEVNLLPLLPQKDLEEVLLSSSISQTLLIQMFSTEGNPNTNS